MELGLYISENGNVVPFEQFGTKSATTDGDVDVPQITINTEARDVIRDLFPRIPDDDINQIIKTAFQKVYLLAPLLLSSRLTDIILGST
jgi:hypothetical protein